MSRIGSGAKASCAESSRPSGRESARLDGAICADPSPKKNQAPPAAARKSAPTVNRRVVLDMQTTEQRACPRADQPFLQTAYVFSPNLCGRQITLLGLKPLATTRRQRSRGL